MAVSKSQASMKEVKCSYEWITPQLNYFNRTFSSQADGGVTRILDWKITGTGVTNYSSHDILCLHLLTDLEDDDEIHLNYSLTIEEGATYRSNQVAFKDTGTFRFKRDAKTCWNHRISNILVSGLNLKITYHFSYKDIDICAKNKVDFSREAVCGTESFGEFKSVTELTENFGQLLLDPQFSDVTLCVKGKEFGAHKNILSARSPVFSAMFQHEMKENVENKVEIQDLEPETVQEMLNFIYTGSVPNLSKIMADQLLEAADRYELKTLEIIAEEHLISNILLENAIKLLVLADLHSATKLYNETIQFVADNAKELQKTEDWKEIMLEPRLMADAILSEVVKGGRNQGKKKRRNRKQRK